MSKREGAAVFILHENKILLLFRKKEPYKNCWCPPGGKMDNGESPAACAIRETLEEVNLHVTLEQELGSHVNPETGFLNHFFTATVLSGSLNNNEPEKHETVAWFSLDQLPEQLNWTMRKWLELQNTKSIP